MPTGALAGGIAVVIDVLRASTTIVAALAGGASRVRPVLTVDDARALRGGRGGPADPLLGGERGGLRIEGFDLGNSPLEYGPERVRGREIVITTTNGTAALAACTDAVAVVVGAVVNRSAAALAARELARRHGASDIHLVCAGTDGIATEEDILAAGAILDAAARDAAAGEELDEPASAARSAFRDLVAGGSDPARAIASAFAVSRGGRNLLALGMRDDLAAAAAIDSLPVVPRLDRATGWLVSGSGD